MVKYVKLIYIKFILFLFSFSKPSGNGDIDLILFIDCETTTMKNIKFIPANTNNVTGPATKLTPGIIQEPIKKNNKMLKVKNQATNVL